MTAEIVHLADYRPCQIHAIPLSPEPTPPAAAARPSPPPETVNAVAGGDVDGWGLPEHAVFDRATGAEPRLLTVGDRVVFDRGRSQITEGVIIHLNPERAIVSVRMTDGRDRGHVVARACHEVHLLDTGTATRVRTGS
jgi:hypothetical protein